MKMNKILAWAILLAVVIAFIGAVSSIVGPHIFWILPGSVALTLLIAWALKVVFEGKR